MQMQNQTLVFSKDTCFKALESQMAWKDNCWFQRTRETILRNNTAHTKVFFLATKDILWINCPLPPHPDTTNNPCLRAESSSTVLFS